MGIRGHSVCSRSFLKNIKHKSTRRAQTSAKGADIMKISSKSVHNFLTYLSLKITFYGSRRSRSLPKLNHFFLLPFPKISSKSVHKFLIYLVHKPTEKHNLLGGGNKEILQKVNSKLHKSTCKIFK